MSPTADRDDNPYRAPEADITPPPVKAPQSMEDLSEKELRELAEAWAGLRGLAYGHKLLGGLFFIIAV